MDAIKVFLVDDDSIFCFLFQKLLDQHSNKSIELIVFHDGYSAAEYFRKNKSNPLTYPDILFIDINMPLMNGWELLETIYNEDLFKSKNVMRYIISSSISNADKHHRNKASDYIEFITKPISNKDLFSIIDNITLNNKS